ncbi:unnamed protein product [Durusdinium trenchii]|uniref:Uncharacterized protein n=1 Tax=Durusdinium trenchii TaxID=1381693 RepID=A0ABP0RUV2_9DINO
MDMIHVAKQTARARMAAYHELRMRRSQELWYGFFVTSEPADWLSKYALEGQAGWVELDDLMQKCKSQIRYSREEVLSVARDSEGSQGKRFEVHPTGGWLRARYRHNGTSNGKGKEGKERRNGSHSGYSYASGTIENTGWDNYQGPESFSSTPPWSSNGILSMYFDLGFVEDMCCW